MTAYLERVVSKFPEQISLAFAYGSGIFAQKNQQVQNNVLDFTFVVDNPLEWHNNNLKLNRKHYSWIKSFGPKFVSSIQEDYGAKVYYNTLVPLDGRTIKYGVIKTSHLIEDLLDWDTLYISGRMQKPITILKNTKNIELQNAMVQNLQSAMHTALLCLPELFKPDELFMKIASLSYKGDFRMIIGENKNKIANIVSSQVNQFQNTYGDIIKNMPLIHWKQGQGVFEQDCSPLSLLHHLNLLPRKLQHNLLLRWNRDGRYRDMEEVLQALAYDSEYSNMINTAVEDIVFNPSLTQSCKGILTAGWEDSSEKFHALCLLSFSNIALNILLTAVPVRNVRTKFILGIILWHNVETNLQPKLELLIEKIKKV